MAKKIEIKKTTAAATTAPKREERSQSGPVAFAFGKENYMIILGGVAVLILGYLLMVGGGADKPENFNPEIFDTQRITIAPVTLLIGFGIVLFGIMKKPRG
jgi:hypothetical protein